jgi:hypothetical protein
VGTTNGLHARCLAAVWRASPRCRPDRGMLATKYRATQWKGVARFSQKAIMHPDVRIAITGKGILTGRTDKEGTTRTTGREVTTGITGRGLMMMTTNREDKAARTSSSLWLARLTLIRLSLRQLAGTPFGLRRQARPKGSVRQYQPEWQHRATRLKRKDCAPCSQSQPPNLILPVFSNQCLDARRCSSAMVSFLFRQRRS